MQIARQLNSICYSSHNLDETDRTKHSHINATKKYLHVGRFARDAVLSSNFICFASSFVCLLFFFCLIYSMKIKPLRLQI